MVVSPRTTARTDTRAKAVAGFSIALALLLAGALLASGGLGALGLGIAALGAALFLLAVPNDALPSIALAAYAFLPNWLFGSAPFVGASGVAPLVLVVWAARSGLEGLSKDSTRSARNGSWRRPSAYFALLLAVSVLISLSISEYRDAPSTPYGPASWAASIVISVALPAMTSSTDRARSMLLNTWAALGALVGLLVVAEQFVGSPLVYNELYSMRSMSIEQRWSVYRSLFSFSHPLYAGLFLAIATSVAIGLWLHAGRRRHLVMGTLAFAGAIATVSRGSIVAAALGAAAAAVIVAISRAKSRSATKRLAVLGLGGGVVLFAALNLGLVSDRTNSAEATASSGARLDVVQVALDLWAESPFFGSGPGTSSEVASTVTRLVIENSWLQLLVSLGIVGFVLVACIFADLIISSIRALDAPALGAVVCFVACLSTFNALDDVPSMHVLVGLMIVLTPGVRTQVGQADPQWRLASARG